MKSIVIFLLFLGGAPLRETNTDYTNDTDWGARPPRVLAIALSRSRTFASVFNDSILSLLIPGFAGRSSQKSFRPRKNLTTNSEGFREQVNTNPRETEDHGLVRMTRIVRNNKIQMSKREPTNHANRRERNSGTRITKPFRVFGVFRGQIAY